MRFIETPFFIKQINKFGSTEILNAIKKELAEYPERGDVIQGTKGARKGRIANPAKGKGKRGGFRYIYAFFIHADSIVLLHFYSKGKKDDLTQDEKTMLSEIIVEIRKTLEGK